MGAAKEDWGDSAPYERYIGRWSRAIGREFVAWLDLPPGSRWADVGCGTGALAAGIVERAQPGRVLAADRSLTLLRTAHSALGAQGAAFTAALAAALPWANGAVDAAVAGLLLNFVPDSTAMLREMARITRPGGVVAVYVWDYSGGMQMTRHFWDVAAQVDPHAAALDQGERFPICQPEPLRQAFTGAGLHQVTTCALTVPTVFRDFDDFWLPFLGRQGSAPTYLAGVSAPIRDAIRAGLRARLPSAPDGSITLTAAAWAARGVV